MLWWVGFDVLGRFFLLEDEDEDVNEKEEVVRVVVGEDDV